MNEDFKTQILNVFAEFFEQYVFSVHDFSYDSRNFGNAVLILNSTHIDIRFIKDRGQVFIDIKPSSDVIWFRLEDILSLIPSSEVNSRDYISHDLEKSSELINQFYEEITDLFRGEEYSLTKRRVDHLINERRLR